MPIETSMAYTEGKNALLDGLSVNACPYDNTDDRAKFWRNGYFQSMNAWVEPPNVFPAKLMKADLSLIRGRILECYPYIGLHEVSYKNHTLLITFCQTVKGRSDEVIEEGVRMIARFLCPRDTHISIWSNAKEYENLMGKNS